MRFNQLLMLLVGVVMLTAGLLAVMWWSNSEAAMPPLVALPTGITPNLGGCERAKAAASSLKRDQLARQDMLAVLRDLDTNTNVRVNDTQQQGRQHTALKHSQELVNMEIKAITELQAMVKAFQQQQHCVQTK